MSDELPPKGDTKQTGKEQDAPNAKTDKIEALIATLVKINQSNRKADNAEHKRTDRREKRNLCLHIAELVLITVYAIFTIAEWWVFHTESNTMQTELQTVQSNSAAERTFNKSQLDEMKRTREVDERAWVFAEITNSFASVIDQTNYVVQIKIKNTGKTPAIITGIWDHESGNRNYITNTDPTMGGLNVMLVPNDPTYSVPSTYPTALVAENFPIYIWGTVYYDDIFGEHHWTQFCYTMTDRGIHIYPAMFHNSCDNAQKNQAN